MPEHLKLPKHVPVRPTNLTATLIVRDVDPRARAAAAEDARAARLEQERLRLQRFRERAESDGRGTGGILVRDTIMPRDISYSKVELVTPAMKLLMEARDLISKKAIVAALEVLDRLLATYAQSVEAFEAAYVRSGCLLELGRPEQALHALSPLRAPTAPRRLAELVPARRARIRPRMAEAVVSEVRALEDGDRLDEALDRTSTLLDLDPDSGLYYLLHAQVQRSIGQTVEALETLDRGRDQLSLDDPDALDEARPSFVDAAIRTLMASARDAFMQGYYPASVEELHARTDAFADHPLRRAFLKLAEARVKKPRAAPAAAGEVSADDLCAFLAEARLDAALAGLAENRPREAVADARIVVEKLPSYRYGRFVFATAVYRDEQEVDENDSRTLEQRRDRLQEALDHATVAAADESITDASRLVSVLEENVHLFTRFAIEIPLVFGLFARLDEAMERVSSETVNEVFLERLGRELKNFANNVKKALDSVELEPSKLLLGGLQEQCADLLKQISEARATLPEIHEIEGMEQELMLHLKRLQSGQGDAAALIQAVWRLRDTARAKAKSFHTDGGRARAQAFAAMLDQLTQNR